MSSNTTGIWIRVIRIVGLVLVIWSAVTLVSGLLLADVGVEGRSYRFEDATIFGQQVGNYQTLAWIGGGIGVVLLVVPSLLNRAREA